MKELLIATGNAGKMREFTALFACLNIKLYSLKDFPNLPPVEEDGTNFRQNAFKKASAAASATGLAVIADDSGLCVDVLGGRPGVLSARFAGEGAGDAANNLKLLDELAGIPLEMRTAAFHCVIALCLPRGESTFFNGCLKGVILKEPSGSGGFGYDPLFLVPEYGKTLAELSQEIKNGISHRGVACDLLRKFLLEKD